MNENQRFAPDNDEIEIDLAEIFGVVWHWMWLIVLVALAFGIAGYSFSRFVLPEEFESTTKIYVLDKNDDKGSQVSYQDMQVGTQLTKDYREMITSRYVLEAVIADLQLDYGYSTLKNKVAVTTPTDSRVMSITVTDYVPRNAQILADSIREHASEHIKYVMDIDAVNVVEPANLPDRKSAPSNSRWAMLAALAGAVAVAAVVILRYILDDTIKTSEDVERYLGLSTLALIPLDEGVTQISEKGQNRQKKRRKSDSASGSSSQTRASAYDTGSSPRVRREESTAAADKEARARRAARGHQEDDLDLRYRSTGVLPSRQEVSAELEKQEETYAADTAGEAEKQKSAGAQAPAGGDDDIEFMEFSR